MAKYILNAPRKQRTRAHILADLSANHVEKCALQCGFAVERLRQDYGLDLAIFTFDDDGMLEGGVIWMQLKATDRVRITRDGAAMRVRIDRRDILSWIAEGDPVILILYDAPRECAYWLWIQNCFADETAFAKLHGQTVTVPISTSSVLSAAEMRKFAQAKAWKPRTGGRR